ncbi:MAG TPA: uroporphyrinogen-III C-methyltransferase [Candidatus Angelobacter sp.]|nr:uroporphyrinogen-III C-methyltransferase [Candidatus Angelobacter sp.]
MPEKVSIVGAGPGPADLLTVRAIHALRSAHVVLHDDLVSPDVLALCPRSTQVINVGKRCGKMGHSQQQINELMIEHARRGKSVVRLKSGDPAVFGRLGEELDALREADVAFDIIPGVTAAIAAAAAAELTLTDRRSSSALLILSAHHAAQNTQLTALADPERTTLAVYMPGPDYAHTANALMQTGIEAGTPCLVVSNACRPDQQVRALALGDLALVRDIPAPAVLIVGRVAQPPVHDAQDASLPARESVAGTIPTIEHPDQPSFPFSHPC